MTLNIHAKTDVLSLSDSIFRETVSFVQVFEKHFESPTTQTQDAANRHAENLDILYADLLQRSGTDINDALDILHRNCKEQGLLWLWSKLYNNITYRGQQCVIGDRKSALYMIPMNIAVGHAHQNVSFTLTDEQRNEIIRSLYSHELVDTGVNIAILSDLITESDLSTSIKQHQKITQEFLVQGKCQAHTIPKTWHAVTDMSDIDILSASDAYYETRYIVLCMSGPVTGFGSMEGLINCILEDVVPDEELMSQHDSWTDFMQSDLFGEDLSIMVTTPSPIQIAIATAAEMQNDFALDQVMQLLDLDGSDLKCRLKIYGDPTQLGDDGMGVILCISDKTTDRLIDMIPYAREKMTYFDSDEILGITELLVAKGIDVVDDNQIQDNSGVKMH